MTLPERERLLARVRQVRRLVAARERPGGQLGDPPPDRLEALETRIGHLERLLEGLQDSVHREFERRDRLLAELQAQVRPAAMGQALAEDARNRGLE
jgi:hypothetical protein